MPETSEMRKYIEAFAASYSLNLSQLSDRLGYRSKTSLIRMMDEAVRPKSAQDFRSRMHAHFHLSPKQEEELDRALHIKINGLEDYMVYQELVRFIHPVHEIHQDDLKIQILSGTGHSKVEHHTLTDLYRNVSDLKITILNCQYVHLYFQLQALLTNKNARVQQFLHGYKDTAHTISSITSVLPVCFSENYSVGFYDEPVRSEKRLPFGLSMTDIMNVTYYDENGMRYTDIIIFVAEDLGIMVVQAPYETVQNPLLQSRIGKYYWIKSTPSEKNIQTASFLSSRSALAHNTQFWSFKADLFLSQFPENILYDSICTEKLKEEEIKSIQTALSKLVTAFRVPRQHIFMIHKKRSMTHFAETGLIQGHPFFMNTFSPSQRIKVFNHLIDEQDRNPYFHIFFLRDDNSIDDMEISCFDHKGILIVPESSNSNAMKSYSEVFVNNPEFTAAYKKFYMQEMVIKLCFPESASISILKSLRNLVASKFPAADADY